jgi:hypothetical protein
MNRISMNRSFLNGRQTGKIVVKENQRQKSSMVTEICLFLRYLLEKTVSLNDNFQLVKDTSNFCIVKFFQWYFGFFAYFLFEFTSRSKMATRRKMS